MKTLIGGAVAAVLGLIGLSVWFGEFLQLLAGAIPVMLLLGGGLGTLLYCRRYRRRPVLRDLGDGENAAAFEDVPGHGKSQGLFIA